MRTLIVTATRVGTQNTISVTAHDNQPLFDSTNFGLIEDGWFRVLRHANSALTCLLLTVLLDSIPNALERRVEVMVMPTSITAWYFGEECQGLIEIAGQLAIEGQTMKIEVHAYEPDLT